MSSASGEHNQSRGDDQSRIPPSQSPSQSPKQPQFVYPVRSLLSGVQPAKDPPNTPPQSPGSDEQFRTSTTASMSPSSSQTTLPKSRSEQLLSPDRSLVSFTSRSRVEEEREGLFSRVGSPNRGADKRTEPTGGTPGDPSHSRPKQESGSTKHGSYIMSSVVAPDGSVITFTPQSDRDPDEYSARHPQPFAAIAAEALLEYNDPRSFGALAMGGYVHLGPSSSSEGSTRGSKQGSAGSSSFFGRRNRKQIASNTASVNSGRYLSSKRGEASEQDEQSAGLSVQQSEASSLSQAPVDGQLVSFRFEHVQTHEGNHVLIGREGKLTKCEDEPIRVPGAVQCFGVLIAIEEDSDSGSLMVRQVSENSREIIGLSPKYLFSLDCFTDTLPDSQAEILWQNTEYLHEPDTQINEAPQVFLLSGWGEPNSARPDERDHPDPQNRRRWTCWCAVHRPPGNNGPDSTASSENASGTKSPTPLSMGRNLIVLELELENDIFNPLYPPPKVNSQSSGSTPGGLSSSGTATDGDSAYTGSTVTLTSLVDESESATDKAISNFQASSDPMQSTQTETQQMHLIPTSGPSSQVVQRPLFPTPEDIFESTTNYAKPILALERMRRAGRGGYSSFRERTRRGSEGGARKRGKKRGTGGGTMDVFAVLAQINEQLNAAQDLPTFLKVVVGIVKDITQFHRVLIYQFDEQWNGQVVAELVDWSQTQELYNTLHFPASDIPAQARELYAINKVRLLYDRGQTTARLVVRDKSDLEQPLNMTHSFLRAMSPIHVKYLGNMNVRASMSISIMTFGALWGLITCHSFGDKGMRVSFPVRQMLRLLSDSVSRNIERLSYAQRLHTRKLISTIQTDERPTGYIITNAEDLLSLFDADFGVLVIGDGAKILGPNQHGQEILIISEYLRLKQFKHMQVSQVVTKDFPDLQLTSGLDVIAGLLYVPLTSGGKDFIVFLRKGQLRDVHWAGRPFKDKGDNDLEPRKSFAIWSEKVAGRCRAWTDEQLETAGVLALVYGKFIEVWRQKESALQTTQLTNNLLSNASHEVRTPLNHIINYLEMALNGPLDSETRENLLRSHAASKGLLFTINDLLDLTRLESGGETSFMEPFDLRETIAEAANLYSIEARRRNLNFNIDVDRVPETVVGDAKKIRTIIANLTANAVKFTSQGSVTIKCRPYVEPQGLRSQKEVVMEVEVADTGCGIPPDKLETLFREFEQVEIEEPKPKPTSSSGMGLGLAVVARIIEQLGGQLRVESKVSSGSRFSFLVPFATTADSVQDGIGPQPESDSKVSGGDSARRPVVAMSSSASSGGSEIESLIEALGSLSQTPDNARPPSPGGGQFKVKGSGYPVRALKVDGFDLDAPSLHPRQPSDPDKSAKPIPEPPRHPSVIKKRISTPFQKVSEEKLRVLVVEDDKINRSILCKRLKLDGHEVLESTNGQEAVEMIEADRRFDIILMDIQMPILNGFESTEHIRAHEKANPLTDEASRPRSPDKPNQRIPIFAVSASLYESQRESMVQRGMDGWILKPIDFKRLRIILKGINDLSQRSEDIWRPGCNWEAGGWLHDPEEHETPP